MKENIEKIARGSRFRVINDVGIIFPCRESSYIIYFLTKDLKDDSFEKRS